MTHSSSFRYSEHSPEAPSGARSSGVRVRYFDPVTGEPCDSKPEPLSKQREQMESVRERDAKRRKAEQEAAEIMRKMAERKKAEQAERKRKAEPKPVPVPRNGKRDGRTKPVLVDGVLFESATEAAKSIGANFSHFCAVLRNGGGKCKGHRIEFARWERHERD